MHAFAVNLRRLLGAMVRQGRELRLQQTASSLTLLTLLAVVPMVALGLLVLTALPAFESMRGDLQRYLETHLFLPSFSDAVVRSINRFVGAADRLSTIGTAAFLATGLGAMLTIDRTLNGIWQTLRPRPLWQRLVLYWALLTLGPILLAAAITLQLKVQSHLQSVAPLTQALSAVLPTALSILVLTLLYRLAPNERVRWLHAVAGAALAVVLLNGLMRLLGFYVTRFPTYTLVYGAFAALPLFLLWLFAVWMSVLTGALFAANLRFWGMRGVGLMRGGPAAQFDRTLTVLRALLEAGNMPQHSAQLRAAFSADAQAADRMAAQLADQGYLVRVWPASGAAGALGVWDEYWLAGPGLRTMTLRPVFERLWYGRTEASSGRSAVPHAPEAPQASAQRLHSGLTTLDPGSTELDRPLGEWLIG